MAENYGELSRLERARQGAINPQATSAIAQAFNNGPAQQANWAKGAQQSASLANIMAEAEERQKAGVARDALAAIARKSGNEKLAQMFLAGGNSEALAKTDQTAQETSQRGTMFNEASSTDPASLEKINRQVLAGFSKEPVSLADVKDNTIVDRFKTAGDQNFNPTAIGQADIGEKGAQAQSALAAAFEHSAQGQRAMAGIGADKAANHEVLDTPDGRVDYDKITGSAKPIMMGGKPVAGKIPAEKQGEKLPEGILKSALAPDGGTTPDPAMLNRYLMVKQQMGKGASDTDVIQRLRSEDAGVAADGKPYPDAAPPTSIAQAFGAPDAGTADAGAMPATPPGAPAAATPAAPAPAPSTGKPSLQEFLTSARVHNPGKSDSELVDYYNATYGQ